MSELPSRALVIVSKMDAGGAETVMMKYYRALDKRRFQLDFCVSERDKGFYDDEIASLGGRIYHVAKKSEHPLKALADVKRLVSDQGYTSVVRNACNGAASFDLFAAKLGGADNLVFRSTNTETAGKGIVDGVAHRLGKLVLRSIATQRIAPSEDAAKFMYGTVSVEAGKCCILPNAISFEDYKFNGMLREERRATIGIDADTLLLGSVGRLVEQKNQAYSIDVLCELFRSGVNAHLVLLGKGALKEELERKAQRQGVDGLVHFIDPTRDVVSWYSAFDVLLLPSHFEGMPNVLIEAQAAGLPCVVSDRVTRDAAYTPHVDYIDTDEEALGRWVDACQPSSKDERLMAGEYIKSSQFDMRNAVKTFERLVFPGVEGGCVTGDDTTQ